MDATPEQTLAALGFTELETRIYVALLRHSPQTGYGLARSLGKAAANIYQALSALALKGAVLLEEAGGSRTASAVAPGELLERLERRFDQSRRAAETALARVHVQTPRDRLYQVQDVEQLYAKAESIIDGAGEIVLFDLFPEPHKRLDAALQRAAARGVRVTGLSYQATDASYPTMQAPRTQIAFERWPGWQVTVVADAQAFVLGLIDRDGRTLLHGLCSDSTYLACMQHNGLAAEITMGSLAAHGDTGAHEAISLLDTMPAGLRRLTDSPCSDGAPT